SQKLDAPILLASKNSVESSIVSYLRDNKELANIKVFGGVNAIGSKVFKDLENSYYTVGENGEKVIDGGTIIVEKVKNNSTDKPNATTPVETGTQK
ncbi:MAG: cell wall-binding repeat-containing protein, partial [Finegoldia magna]|nr:cell wall-binding repeat-containing protein [Finegoldia magna]